ncbi:MAG: hypothetical protein J4G10_07200 [Alphaproteobacteria bacterium]|nr:hypothetical protein [Alphaproteobacteria bacterium]
MTVQIEDLKTVTDQLVVLMDRETSLLREHRHDDLRDLQVEKSRLAHIYENHLRGLRERPENLQNIKPDLLEGLKISNVAFRKATQSNALALKAAMEANDHVLRAIAAAAAELNANGKGYKRDGNSATKQKAGVSIALDREL